MVGSRASSIFCRAEESKKQLHCLVLKSLNSFLLKDVSLFLGSFVTFPMTLNDIGILWDGLDKCKAEWDFDKG